MLNWIVWNRTVYLFKMDLALNNLQRWIYYKTLPNKQNLPFPHTHANKQTNKETKKKEKITGNFFRGELERIHVENDRGCLNIHGIHVTSNNFTNNDVVFFCVSDLQTVYYNNY